MMAFICICLVEFGNIDRFPRFPSATSTPLSPHNKLLRLVNIFKVMLVIFHEVWLICFSLFNLLHALWPDIEFLNRQEVFKCASLLCLGRKGELLPL